MFTTGVWAVVDLYGQCAEVQINHLPIYTEHVDPLAIELPTISEPLRGIHDIPQLLQSPPISPPSGTTAVPQILHRWSHLHGPALHLSPSR